MTLAGTDSSTPYASGAALYASLLGNARRAGRCPVLLGYDAAETARLSTQPDDAIAAIGSIDTAIVLARWWPGPCRPECPCDEQLPTEMPGDPAGPDCPDMSRTEVTIAAAARHAVERGAMRMFAMVDAHRPADIPAVLGWIGIDNYYPFQDLERLCAVLRRWEERYGALLVHIDRSSLRLSVAHPPTTDDGCRRVAAEHFAFCPDQQDPQNGDFYTLSRYAAMMRGARSWHFWWD